MIRIGSAALTIPALPFEDDWRLRAACTPKTADLFFPDGTSGLANKQKLNDAKTICMACPVRIQCLNWSFDTRQEFGVFGGVDERDRRALLRNRGDIKQRGTGRKPAECGTRAAYDRHVRRGEPVDHLCATKGRYERADKAPAEVAA